VDSETGWTAVALHRASNGISESPTAHRWTAVSSHAVDLLLEGTLAT